MDDQGRVVILHGFNIMIKGSPFYPSLFSDQDAQFLADEGFTTARLGWSWEGAEPQPGVYDDAYIQKIAHLDDLMGRYGIRTLVDAHQDQYSRAAFAGFAGILGGDGAPAWATRSGTSADANFARFWNDDAAPDGVGIQTHFVNTWKRVAAAFADHKNVLGYDPLNEPYPGSGYPAPCADFAPCPAFETGALAQFYRRFIEAIRPVDRSHMVFPEGIAQNAKAPTSLPTFADPLTGFNWHYYCTASQLVNPDPTPVTSTACESTDASAHATITDDIRRLNEPWIISEWGSADADDEYARQVDWMGSQFVSWMEWAYYQDLTGGGNIPNQGLLLDDNQPGSEQNAKQLKLNALVVPYPQATAGTPLSYTFDRTTDTMTYSYTTVPAGGRLCPTAPTQIFVPWRKYPTGYRVQVSGAEVASSPGSAWVELIANPGASSVTVTISPGVSVPPAPTQTPSQTMAQAPATIQLCAAADLAPTSLSLSPTKVKGGDLVTFQTEVANLGGTPAANVAVRFLLDGAQLGTERTIASLAAGASAAVSSVAWTAKHEDGSHRVTVLVDPANVVSESNEANNSREATFLVQGNKIGNGSFEQSSNGSSPDAWTASGETGYQTGGSGAGSGGGRSVWAAPGGSWTSDPVAVEVGRRYEASVFAFGAGGTLVVQQLGPDGRVLGSTAQPLLPTMAFVLAELPVTALEGATQVRVVLLGGLGGTTTFDDVWLVES